MKTFGKILIGILLFIIIVLVGLNLYFTDERLKSAIMPYINEGVGRTVQVESISLTFFSTFPRPGVRINQISVPGQSPTDTLLAMDQFTASIELFSLLGDQVNIAEIYLGNPRFTYQVHADSTTNIDFLMDGETDTTAETGTYEFNIPRFSISSGNFGYKDATSGSSIQLEDLNADISLQYGDLISSSVDMELGGLTAVIDSSRYMNHLPISLTQTSTIDMDNEVLQLEGGTLSIRGLALNLNGSIEQWSAEAPVLDLQFNSTSDNFGELLRLVPEKYNEQVAGLETRGRLTLRGSVTGAVGGETIPSFSADINVADGYLKNPDLPEAVQNIQIQAQASNERVTIEAFEATAGPNTITASGTLTDPLEEDAPFELTLDGDVDLTTVDQFFPLNEFSVDKLGGKLTINAQASGQLDKPDEAEFDAVLNLSNGLMKYADVPNTIENITIDAEANQDLVTIKNFNLNAAQNRFSATGQISEPMDTTNRSIDLKTELFFDLATLKDFYPIDEDSLQLRGELTANAVLKGNAENIEQAVQSGSINLNNGYIAYKRFDQPVEEITFSSKMQGNLLSIQTARFRSGKNDLDLTGSISGYLSENPTVDLQVKGNAQFDEVQNYYDLQPTISELSGSGQLDLTVQGPLQEPANLKFNGRAVVNNLNMSGDSLAQPVKNLNGELELRPNTVTLSKLDFNLGASDLAVSGNLQDYMKYLEQKEDRSTTPVLEGTVKSRLFNLDELIDWDDTDTTTTPIPIELPDLNSNVTASIDSLVITGVDMYNLEANAGTTPTDIKLNEASIDLFGGSASGSFTWNVPRPDRTNLNFEGNLDSVEVNAFFREYQVLGQKSNFHEYVSGSFSADINYYSELDVYLKPDISTTEMEGTYTMSKSRIKGHPLQDRLANLLKTDELKNIALDESTTRFSIANSVMTIENLRLTSGDIGAEMNGTRHLVNNKIDYQLKMYLPQQYRKGIASVITTQAVEALTQDNGTILLPLRVTGTQNDPQLRPDQDVIQPIIKEYLKNKAGDVLKNLFGN